MFLVLSGSTFALFGASLEAAAVIYFAYSARHLRLDEKVWEVSGTEGRRMRFEEILSYALGYGR